MAERSKAAVLKTAVGSSYRGFESLSLRHSNLNNKRGCCKTSKGKQQPFLFFHYIHLKDASRLKGDICGNPALQGGGRSPRKSIRLEDGPRLEDATGLDGDRSRSSVFQTGSLIMLASSPALKSGVTIDDAFQAFFI